MIQGFTVYSSLFLGTTLVTILAAYLAWRRRSVKGGLDLARLMLAAGFGAFCIMFETAAPTVSQKLIWAKLEMVAGVATPVLYLIFVLRFTGHEKMLTQRNIVGLFIIPFITLLFILTNDKHHLFWPDFSVISPETNLMIYHHGLAFWIGYLAYSYLLLLIATFCVFQFIFWHTDTFRVQGWVILTGGLCPWIASIIYLTGSNPIPGLDLSPFSIVLSGALLIYAIQYYRFLDLVPVAREKLIETMPAGILVLDEQNRIQDINASTISFLGISEKNCIGLAANDLVNTENWLLSAMMEQDAETTTKIENHDGTKVYRIIKQMIAQQNGSHLFVIYDITDYVAQQNALREGEEKYGNMFAMFRLMSDNLPDLLWARDLNRKFIFVNQSTCDTLLNAVDTDEPIGKEFSFFVERERTNHPEKLDWYTFEEQYGDSDQIVIHSGKMQRFDEYGNVFGSFIYLDVWKAPILDKNGEMIGVVGSARDVTLQKQSEAEIYKRDLLLNAVANASALLVQGENTDESVKGALEIVGKATGVTRVYIIQNHHNPAVFQSESPLRFEWTDGSVFNQDDFLNLNDLDSKMHFPEWFEMFSSGNTISGSVTDLPEQIRPFLIRRYIKSILITPIMINHELFGVLGLDDCKQERTWLLSEEQILSAAANTIGAAYYRKKQQDALLFAKGEEEKNQILKSAFLANISHEIRTPMNGIMGFAELLKEPELSGDDKATYLNIIEESSNNMLTIINNLVELSKIESGKVAINRSETEVNEQLEYLYELFRPQAEKKGLSLTLIKSDEDEFLTIQTDEEKLLEILVNLLKNAVRYTQKGEISFGCQKKDTMLEYFVKDTGIGISQERQAIIFDRFVHASNLSLRASRGTALGLAIAKAYVEILGGTISVESEEGNGSVFTFTIPFTA